MKGSALRALYHAGEGRKPPWTTASRSSWRRWTRDSGPGTGLHVASRIKGIGRIDTGRVTRGVLAAGGTVEAFDRDGERRAIVVTGIESFHRQRGEARAGENVGLRLQDVKRDELVRGQVLVAPGSIAPHRAGRAELYV